MRVARIGRTTISWFFTITTGATTSFGRASSTSAPTVFMLILSEYRYEHSIELIICWDHSFEDHISKIDCLFFDTESRILCNTKFKIVCWILFCFNTNKVTECIAIERCTYRCLKIGELFSWSDKDDFHKNFCRNTTHYNIKFWEISTIFLEIQDFTMNIETYLLLIHR